MNTPPASAPPPASLVSRVGAVIRNLRDARGWSQEKLAEASELNRTYIGEIERGQVSASLTTMEKLANAFEVPVHALFTQAAEPRQTPAPRPPKKLPSKE